MTVKLSNIGGADARNFETCVVISEDASLSLSGDTEAGPCAVTTNLPVGGSVTLSFEFQVPLVDKNQRPFKTGNYYLGVLADRTAAVTELSEENNKKTVGALSPEPVLLLEPGPDYAVGRVDAPSSAAVGETLPVSRILRNAGNRNGGKVTYRFYASVNDIIDTGDVALPILGNNGQTLDSREITLAAGETDSATEFVRLPATMIPGTWYIGVLIDAANEEVELDETNNGVASSGTVQVAASSMRITEQQLPDAVIGQAYRFKLSVSGAQGPVTWTTADDTLKNETGLDLSPDGVIAGVPKAAALTTFSVIADNGGKTAMARLVLRVLAVSGELVVTSLSLPPVVNSSSYTYKANLAAAGGNRPYTWKVTGTLPNGISFVPADGVFQGKAQNGIKPAEFPLFVEVTDAVGSRAGASIKLKVVDTGAIYISTLNLNETMVGSDYYMDMSAKRVDQGAMEKPLTWSVAAGSLPEGITLSTVNDEVGLLTGKAIVSGTFPVSIQVVDAKQRSDVANFLLRVHPARLKLTAVNQPAVIHPGDAVELQITTGNNSSQFRIFSGTLPPGLSMDQQGHITGTVDMENSVGTWNYVVEAEDAVTGNSLGAFSLEVTPAPPPVGCSAAAGTGMGAMWLTLIAPLLAFFARRRKFAVGLASAAVAVALVGPATAQAQTNPYSVDGPRPSPYSALSGGLSLTTSASLGAPVSLPFDFEFFGTRYKAGDAIGVSQNGYITFVSSMAGDSTNAGIPHSGSSSSDPTVIAAPWWDALQKSGTGSLIKHQTIGAAPNRVLAVEWANVCTSTSCAASARFSFQVQLYEGSNKVRFAYSSLGSTQPSPALSASVGIMGAPNIGVAGLTCTTPTTTSSGGCGALQFPANSYIDFALPADLQILGINSADTGYAEVFAPVSVLVANRGGKDAEQVKVRFYLSSNPTCEASDAEMGDTAFTTVPVNSDKLLTASIAVPAGTAPGDYFLIARVDPDNVVPEGSKESNNVSAPVAFKVGAPTPNLKANSVGFTSATYAPGATVTLSKNISNAGNADMTAPVKVTYYVSSNSVATVDDTPVKTDTLAPLAKGGTDAATVDITLPANLTAGKYWVGLCADYDPAANPQSQLQEISEGDNCVTSNTSLTVNTGALAIVTQTLGSAVQNGGFGLPLEATGGNGMYSWSVESGALPKGLSLQPNGYLIGTPSQAGSFQFTVKVASGTEVATKSFSLEVSPRNLALTIVDQVLPVAEFGRSYSHPLVAVGGTPPYTWTLKADSQLPEGLGFSREGTIEGRATQVQRHPVRLLLRGEGCRRGDGCRLPGAPGCRAYEPQHRGVAVGDRLRG